MPTKKAVIDELRDMFKDGATPSRLIRHIVNRHPDENNWHVLIQDYFREAFNVGIVRRLQVKDDYKHLDLRHSYLNKEVLPEMIEAWGHCATEPALSDGTNTHWCDHLTASSYEERTKELEERPWNELSGSWGALTSDEKDAVNRVLAESRRKSECIEILANLAERLQQQVLELQEQRTKVPDSFSS